MDSKTRLTKQQLDLLQFIYSYRFVTTKQVQGFLGRKQIQQAQQRLNTLLNKQYVGRRYSSDDKLLGRYATYFLLPDGMELIKGHASIKALRLMRKDATASQRFIDHNIAIGEIATDLRRIYKNVLDEVQFHTKTDTMYISRVEYENNWQDEDDFQTMLDVQPQPMSDGYLDGISVDLDKYLFVGFFVEVWHDSVPFWVYRKRIQYLIDYTDSEIWQEYFTGCVTPPFLLICDTPTLQRRVQRYLRRIYDSTSHDYQFLVTNREILAETTDNKAIWTRVDDETTETIRLTDVPDGAV